jgi:hypothetical protein
VYFNGYNVSVINIFISVAGFDFYRKEFLTYPDRRPKRAIVFYTYHSLGVTIALIVSLSATPLFGPFAALPLSQEVNICS